jgi:hypothetical protein
MLSGRIADEDLQIGQAPVAWAGLISDTVYGVQLIITGKIQSW